MNVICVGVKTGKCEETGNFKYVNMYKKPPLLEELFAQTLSGENVMYISVIHIYIYIYIDTYRSYICTYIHAYMF